MKTVTIFKINGISAIFVLSLIANFCFGQEQQFPKEYTGVEAAQKVKGAQFVQEKPNRPYPSYVKFQEDKTVPFESFQTWIKSNLNIQDNHRLEQIKQSTNDLGITNHRFIQHYKGIPIDMAWCIVREKEGQVLSFNGHLEKVENQSTTPLLIEKEALPYALRAVGAEKYKWEIPAQEAFLKKWKKDPTATYFPKGQLVWVKNEGAEIGDSKTFLLAWKFEIRDAASILDQELYIDANNGDKVKSYPLVWQCDEGTAATTWNGTKTIYTDEIGQDQYILFDDCPEHNGTILSIQEAGDADYVDDDNSWTENGLRGPATTHYHARVTMDYFDEIHTRDSYDNAGGDIVFRHREDTQNAFYSGGGAMIIGAGDTDEEYYNTLDVVAHEFTHGVVDFEADLTYQGESGALNESFADIFGETCERWHENDQNIDWLHREDYVSGNNRSFINPKDKNDPDTYQGDNWASTCNACGDDGGVHTNSGVQNHWFYLLAEGGTGQNDNNDTYFVEGIGLEKARTIAYDNLVDQLGPDSDYADARTGAIAAAESRYGACSNEVIQVKNAWYAVGVGTPGMPEFDDNNEYIGPCSGEDANIFLFFLQNENEAGATFTWTVDYNGLTGGDGNCNSNCPTNIYENLFNNTPDPITAVYTFTPSYDGCTGPDFTIERTIFPNPEGVNDVEDVLCSGDPFDISLQTKISNDVESDFSWTVEYNGLTGGAGDGSGDNISESLENNTGAVASAIYTVTPTSEEGDCEGSPFTVTVNVPPALFIDAGDNQTVYYGYPPAECATLSWSGEMGGTPPYSVQWSTGENTQDIEVCPTETTDYEVTITDANGCIATDIVTVCVIDVRCGKKLDKVEICHSPNGNNPNTLCVAVAAVASHLDHGDQLAACGTDHDCPPAGNMSNNNQALFGYQTDVAIGNSMKIFPNPFKSHATIEFTSTVDGDAAIDLLDLTGRTIKQVFRGTVEAGHLNNVEVEAGELPTGIYFCRMRLADGAMITKKIIAE